ncbi:MAG TPA: hypothetical protein VIJ14_06530 [Rhabdochlamydiaceae bacterium]
MGNRKIIENIIPKSPKIVKRSKVTSPKAKYVVKVTQQMLNPTISKPTPFQPKQVWKVKNLTSETKVSNNDTSTTETPKGGSFSVKADDSISSNAAFSHHSQLLDVIIIDDTGRPKTIKAWVPLTN